MDFSQSDRDADRPALAVRLLGPLTIVRDGDVLALPASRKVRALLGYLALAPHPVSRTQLCELFWDGPSDPRGELRWCLSKIRGVLDDAARRRVVTRNDAIAVDLADCAVDATVTARAIGEGVEALGAERLRSLHALYSGELLQGLELDDHANFGHWLVAERRRYRGYRAALLERLVSTVEGDEVFGYIDKWLELAPFDVRVHEALLKALASRARIAEGEEHLAATARVFEEEGLDHAPLREIWRAVRTRAEAPLHAGIASRERSADENVVAAGAAGASRRASIAVMPFADQTVGASVPGGLGDGLVHDIITRLAKLRSLFVIAQGSVFALRERRISPEEAARTLNVDYVASGWVRRQAARLTVSVELAEARTARIIWTEVFNHKVDDTLVVLDDIGNRIVAAIEHEIESIERNRAMLRPPNSLDAWEAYHRGLWHMYRFSKADNDRARHFFDNAVRLDPTFARAYAGLSFTHFQNAFQGWAGRAPEIDHAYAAAAQSLMVDERDPAAHWAMGRAEWLRGNHDQSIIELHTAIDLSPNFALGHYTLAFVQSQAGDARAAIRASDQSRHLSPFDPLLFGMLGARALALVRLGRFDEAAEWALKAAARPNAHAHIAAIAAYSLALAARLEEARACFSGIRQSLPYYAVDDFLTAMRFDPAGAALFREAARRIRGR